jgi:hypothetical protein
LGKTVHIAVKHRRVRRRVALAVGRRNHRQGVRAAALRPSPCWRLFNAGRTRGAISCVWLHSPRSTS